MPDVDFLFILPPFSTEDMSLVLFGGRFGNLKMEFTFCLSFLRLILWFFVFFRISIL